MNNWPQYKQAAHVADAYLKFGGRYVAGPYGPNYAVRRAEERQRRTARRALRRGGDARIERSVKTLLHAPTSTKRPWLNKLARFFGGRGKRGS